MADHIYKQVLNLINGCSSQKPYNFDDLLSNTGLTVSELTTVTEQMANKLPALIGKCEVTRYGVKQILIWPTGVVNKASWSEFAVNPNKRPIAPPRRDEVKNTKDKTMSDQVKTAEISEQPAISEKSKALLMLEYMEKYPNCSGAMLRKAANAGTIDSYISGYIKRKDVIKEVHGPRDARYRLAKGMTAEKIYSQPHGKRGQHNKNAPKAGVVTSQSECLAKPVEQQNSPKAQAEVISLGDGDQLDAQGSAITSESTAKPSLPKTSEQQYGPFRVAYTSDGCLMIYGVSFQPVELSKLQAQELFEFVGPQLNLVPQ